MNKITSVTEKTVEDEQLTSEQGFRLLVQSVKDYAIVMLDPAGLLVSWNEGAQRIKGYQAEEIIGKHFSIFYTKEDIASGKPEVELKVAAAQGRFEDEGWRVRKDGSRFWANAIITALRDKDGTLRGYGKVTRDLTERKRAEEEIRKLNVELEKRIEARTHELREAQEKLVWQERLAVLGQLAGGVAHELRNPLGVIKNAVYYLKMILHNPDPTLQEYLDLLQSEVRISEKIITDLLDFSRIKTAAREKVALPDLVRGVLDKRPVSPNIEVSTHISADLPSVFVDPQQIEQVLDNLLINACQAMPDGGLLAINARSEADQIVLTVSDTGCGIAKENMSRIFEPLFTTKAYGIGLGLPLSMDLAEINGGGIAVESEPGKGATFTVNLPIHKEST